MTELILWVLALYVVYIALPPAVQVFAANVSLGNKISIALGPRDEMPAETIFVRRAKRALQNFEQSLSVFLTLAILLIVSNRADGLALTGATTFLFARMAYLPAYLSGVYAVRSIVWTIAIAGLIMMVMRLV